MKKITICGALVLGMAVMATTVHAQSIKERYDNPFIDDGVMETTPFEWRNYDVLETRTEYDDYGTPWLHHHVNKSEASVVAELKKAYRTQKPIAANVYVRGFIFQVQQKTWSFTLAQEGTNIHYVIHVIPRPDRNGSSLALLAKRRRTVSARWKRSWYGFSPVGMQAYSAAVQAY